MKTVSNILAIKDGSVLLVFKQDVWILPGGKREDGESDQDCLLRECSEEIPEAIIEIGPKLGEFEGITPHSGKEIRSIVFFGTVTGNTDPGAEIQRSQRFTKQELEQIPVSDLTKKIQGFGSKKNMLTSLSQDCFLIRSTTCSPMTGIWSRKNNPTSRKTPSQDGVFLLSIYFSFFYKNFFNFC